MSQNLPPTVDELIASMKAGYAAAAKYADTGQVTERRGGSTSSADFHTKMNRDTGEFAFRYQTADRKYTIARSAAGKTMVDDSAGTAPEPRKSLEASMRVARRLTKGTTEIIPALLLPGELGQSGFWNAVSNWSQQPSATVNGVRCSVLRGDFYGPDGTIDLWLDERFVIRQIRVAEKRLGRTTLWTITPKR